MRLMKVGAILTLALLSVGGCGSDPRGERVAVNGSVTLDGEPLSSARIVFVSADGKQTLKSTGLIQNGQFSIPETSGPLAGRMRVEIHADTMDLEEFMQTQTKSRRPSFVAVRIPKKYNVDSTLFADVKQDGPNSFQFALSNK